LPIHIVRSSRSVWASQFLDAALATPTNPAFWEIRPDGAVGMSGIPTALDIDLAEPVFRS